DNQESKDSKGDKDNQESKDSKGDKDNQESKDSKGDKDNQESKDSKDSKGDKAEKSGKTLQKKTSRFLSFHVIILSDQNSGMEQSVISYWQNAQWLL
ncbi:hypothetical protein J5839_01115, partial [Methanosarcinaceae archaeon]|nr:hypothetical protein [Methanosarcinaceae archaeon]